MVQILLIVAVVDGLVALINIVHREPAIRHVLQELLVIIVHHVPLDILLVVLIVKAILCV